MQDEERLALKLIGKPFIVLYDNTVIRFIASDSFKAIKYSAIFQVQWKWHFHKFLCHFNICIISASKVIAIKFQTRKKSSHPGSSAAACSTTGLLEAHPINVNNAIVRIFFISAFKYRNPRFKRSSPVINYPLWQLNDSMEKAVFGSKGAYRLIFD
jgi:hypothetical protein